MGEIEKEKDMRLIDADKLKSEVRNAVPLNMDSVYALINNQPTVNEWIPCSERLPSSDGMFLVTVKSRSGKRIDLCHFNKNAKLDTNKWGGQYYNRNVIAWQQLPQLYTQKIERNHNNAEK